MQWPRLFTDTPNVLITIYDSLPDSTESTLNDTNPHACADNGSRSMHHQMHDTHFVVVISPVQSQLLPDP